MRILCTLLVLACLFVPAVANSQRLPARDPQAVAILQQSFLAMGGASIAGVSDLTMTGRLTGHLNGEQTEGTFAFKLLGTDKNRTDYVLGTEPVSRIVNGTKGTEARGTSRKKLPYHAILNNHPDYLPALTEVREWGNATYRMTFKGLESLDSLTVYHIRVEREFPRRPPDRAAVLTELSAVDLYVDSTSLMLVKRSQKIPSLANVRQTLLVEHYYSDYRPVGNVLVPHRTTTFARGQKITEVTVTSVTFNSGISPAEFEVQ